jgi:anti-sigma factor RsiW
MTCADCLQELGALVDGELPAGEVARIEEHLANCPDCAAAHQRLLDLSSRVKGSLTRYQAPDVLKARVRASLMDKAGDIGPRRVPSTARQSSRWTRSIAAAAAIAVVSSGLTFAGMRERAPAGQVQDEVLASHIRSLMPGHLTDVASNDQHNVKPWFNGRVNLSPDVPRLDSIGYPLVGGRVDYIDGRSVASVVYTRRQHVINVFWWAVSDGSDLAPTLSTSHGYHLIRARRSGIETWIVSDLNPQELESFAGMVVPAR